MVLLNNCLRWVSSCCMMSFTILPFTLFALPVTCVFGTAGGELVIVGVTYRLNAFGFLALPDIAVHDPRGVSGNYGILVRCSLFEVVTVLLQLLLLLALFAVCCCWSCCLLWAPHDALSTHSVAHLLRALPSQDQQQGLRWVQKNIAAFGGDANRVTVYGQSSGGTSILALLCSPASVGLFSGAISLSGTLAREAFAPSPLLVFVRARLGQGSSPCWFLERWWSAVVGRLLYVSLLAVAFVVVAFLRTSKPQHDHGLEHGVQPKRQRLAAQLPLRLRG